MLNSLSVNKWRILYMFAWYVTHQSPMEVGKKGLTLGWKTNGGCKRALGSTDRLGFDLEFCQSNCRSPTY